MHDLRFENITVDIDQLPSIELVEFRPIEPSYRKVLYISNLFYFFMVLFALMVFSFVQLGFLHWLTYVLLLGWLVLFLSSLWFASVSVKKKAYALRVHDISYKEGVFFRSWVTIPFSRVQHCEIIKGVVDNFFNLVELRIFTAGGSSSDLVIPGLRPDVAFRLKEQIIGKIDGYDEEE